MRPRHILVFVVLLASFVVLAAHNVSPEPYVYDEADYMYAASLGFAANWSDTPSIPIADFVRAGRQRHNETRGGLSERIRAGGDVLFYRHFHGPLFHYLLIPLQRLHLSERAVRTVMLTVPCASLAVIYFGCLWLGVGGLTPAALFLCSYSVVWSTELAPHQLFALFSLVSLMLLLKAVTTCDRRYWCGAVIASGLAFCALEIALVLILTLAICCFLERRRLRADRRFIAKSLGLLWGTILAVWPAALFRLSFLKGYAVLAYLALDRSAAWGHAGIVESWRTRILSSPLEWSLILLGILIWSRTRHPNLYPITIFVALMLAATLRVVTETPRYSLAFMPELDLLAGLALVPLLGPLRRPASFAVVALAVAALYGSAWYQAIHHPHNPNPRSAAVVSFIYQNGLENKSILAPQTDLPTLHYYFPRMRLVGYFGPVPTPPELERFTADAIIPAAKP